MLFNVSPTLPIEDSLDTAMTYVEHAAKANDPKPLFFLKSPYFTHLVFGENTSVDISSAQTLSEVIGVISKRSLLARILGIVFMRAKKQVIWIYARWVIASWAIVANQVQLFGKSMNRPAKEIPSPSMGIDRTTGIDLSITSLGFGFIPYPAAIGGYVHAFHKCAHGVWKLIAEELCVSLGNKHRELSHGIC